MFALHGCCGRDPKVARAWVFECLNVLMFCSFLTVFVDCSLVTLALSEAKSFCVSPSCPLIVEEIVDLVQICFFPRDLSCHISSCLCRSWIVEEIVEMVQILLGSRDRKRHGCFVFVFLRSCGPHVKTAIISSHQKLGPTVEGRGRLPKKTPHSPTLRGGAAGPHSRRDTGLCPPRDKPSCGAGASQV